MAPVTSHAHGHSCDRHGGQGWAPARRQPRARAWLWWTRWRSPTTSPTPTRRTRMAPTRMRTREGDGSWRGRGSGSDGETGNPMEREGQGIRDAFRFGDEVCTVIARRGGHRRARVACDDGSGHDVKPSYLRSIRAYLSLIRGYTWINLRYYILQSILDGTRRRRRIASKEEGGGRRPSCAPSSMIDPCDDVANVGEREGGTRLSPI